MARKEIAADGDSPLERAPRDAEVGPGTVGGAAGLRAENRRLRLELSRLQSLHGDLTQVVLPADGKAPSAARTLLSLCFGTLLDARVLSDAQLLVSELVTNSLVHGALGDEDGIVVRMQLHAEALRLEVHNRGAAGTIAANGGDPVRGRGFGLDLVRMLSDRWGVRRGEDTCVWVEMARA